MTEQNDVNPLILQLNKTLSSWRKQAEGITSDSNVLHWQKVNIESFNTVIESLGLNPLELRKARDNYANLAQKELQRVAFLANELNNLESDMKLGPLAPDVALAIAQKIKEQCQELKPDIDILVSYHKTLAESSKTLKENLNFLTFLPQARLQASGKKKSLFETGYSIYLTITDDDEVEHEENISNMFRYFTKASHLHATIAQTDIPHLPAMVKSFVDQQLRLCLEGCEQVKFFITFVSDYFQTELETIKSFQTRLETLKEQSLTEVLLEIPSQTNAASKCIQAFSHKKFLLEDIQKANRLLTNIETFHGTLTNSFFPYLVDQTDKKNGLLNPVTLAVARSKKYFTGFRGLWRFVLMLLFSFGANAIISQEELQEKIEESIRKCSFYTKQHGDDNHLINQFTDDFFSEYKQPFPHDELVDIMKKCIVTYATILEKVYMKYKPKQAIIDEDQPQAALSLGRLGAKIEIRTKNLEKYRKKFEDKK
ncbi:MAG: hypothetical protein ABFS09_03540 [Thermodesulfobacteriota bacterium]